MGKRAGRARDNGSQPAFGVAENFAQTPSEHGAYVRLADQEMGNPLFKSLDRTEGARPHRVEIEQAAKLIYAE
jgi:hypothetical protein